MMDDELESLEKEVNEITRYSKNYEKICQQGNQEAKNSEEEIIKEIERLN